MLALNASVEAVRAGEQGKGFSVIAVEIRKLADQSRTSADNIKNLINDIQTSIDQTVSSTQKSTQKLKDSVVVTEKTAEAFAGVAGAIEGIVISSQQIYLNAKQQTSAVSEVLENVTQLSESGNETTKSISAMRRATERLNEMVSSLHKLVL